MSHEINFDGHGNIILSVNWRQVVKVAAVAAVTVASAFLPIAGLTGASRICLMIFVGAAGLWVTEAIPPFATATMVIVVSVYVLGAPAGPLQLDRTGVLTSYQIFLNPIASPVLVLFFGGFILAVAAAKHGLDVRLAKVFIKPFGHQPRMVLLGVILTTATFSMFMSNTATAAMMIAILGPLFKHFEGRDPFKKALVLAVPFAANIGGMATIIGTPPNAVAASILGQMGHPVSFVRWMMIALPVTIVLLMILWALLIAVFRPRTDHLEVLFPDPVRVTWDLVVVVITFAVTLFLWLMETVIGVPAAVVAMLPVMVFTMLGIIDRDDLKRIEWHVLILIAGGLTLGVAMSHSGLSALLSEGLSRVPLSGVALVVAVAVVSVVVSNFMSHTAAANLMIPIVTSMAVVSPVLGAVAVALACSLAMSLPISTPPNALAFATQTVETKDMVRYGSMVSIVGMIVMLLALVAAHSALHVL